MSRQTALLTLLVGVLLGLVLLYRPQFYSPYTRKASTSPPGEVGIPLPDARVSPFRRESAGDSAALRRDFESVYRLSPDRRVLLAVAEIRRIVRGDSLLPTAATFQDSTWSVSCGPAEVGALPHQASFAQAMALLVRWARAELDSGGADRSAAASIDLPIRRQLAACHPLDALAAIEAQRARDGRGPGPAQAATRALVQLALQTTDLVGASDPVGARALAALAIARAQGVTGLERDEALLAHTLGYTAEAVSLASRLAAGDAVRAYVMRDDATLRELATSARGDREAKVLVLWRLSNSEDVDEWRAWLSHEFARGESSRPALVSSGMRLRNMAAHEPVGWTLVESVLEELEQQTGPDTTWMAKLHVSSLAQLVDRFEADIRRLPGDEGRYLDASLIGAHYRSLFYSALDVIGEHYMVSVSSQFATRWFAAELNRGASGAGGEFQSWFQHMARLQAGQGSNEAVAALSGGQWFGMPLRIKLYQALQPYLPLGDPAARRAARAVVAASDSRPDDLWEVGFVLRHAMWLPTMSEELLTRSAELQGHAQPLGAAWLALERGDSSGIATLLRDPGLRGVERRQVLMLMRGNGWDDDELIAEFQRGIERDPRDWDMVDQLTGLLDEHRQYARARAALERYLANEPRDGIAALLARAAIARTYDLEGDPERGLQALGNLASSQQFGVMRIAALLLDHAGRGAQALRVAQAAADRYPDLIDARLLVAEIQWRHGESGEAARALFATSYPMTQADWRWKIGTTFASTFHGRPAQGLAAAEALLQHGPHQEATHGALAVEAFKAGDPELAFEIESRLKPLGMERYATLASSCRWLEAWKGKAAALQWIRPKIAGFRDEERGLFVSLALSQGLVELPWAVEPPAAAGVDRDGFWLMRAAAWLRSHRASAAQREALVAHYRGAGDMYYHRIGRYLVGLSSRDDILAFARTPQIQCEVFYYLGLMAQTDGRIVDAARWYEMVLETGMPNNIEYRWAADQLTLWTSRPYGLSRFDEMEKRVPEAVLADANW